MIFNSISKELNTTNPYRGSYNPHDYQPAQPTHQSRLSNANYISESRLSESGSAISQMNKKIMGNLDYLKYKDHVRENTLRNSRVSNRSTRSHHSNQSQRSMHSVKYIPRVEVASNFRFAEVRTPKEQHYFPQKVSIKPQFSNWHKPTGHQHSSTQPAEEPQYKEFTRKPITIQEYSNKYGLIRNTRKAPQKDVEVDRRSKININQAVTDGIQFQMFGGSSNQKLSEDSSKRITFSPAQPYNNRDYAHSFGSDSKREMPSTSRQSQPFRPQLQFASPSLHQKPSQQVKVLSPLPVSNKKKQGVIIGVVLVTLGLLLLILQISK